jgi:predicted transposase/invertase (TIGR01784 family)
MENNLLETGRPVERLNPLNDYLFLKMMGEKGDEEQLLGFLNAVLKRTQKDTLVSVEIIENRTLTADIIGDKASILDVRAKADDGTKVNIEVQLKNLGNMDKRSLFYWSQDYTRSIEAGDDYKVLPNVIAINIVNFEYLGTKNFHTSFHLREDTERDYILTEALEIHFIDMVKFKKLRDRDIKNDPLQRWMTWFDQGSSPEIVEEVVNMDTAIRQAEKRMTFVSNDKEALRAYQMREMALSDWTSGVNYARQEGKLEGKLETAHNMKADKTPMDLILKYTGLTPEQIKDA